MRPAALSLCLLLLVGCELFGGKVVEFDTKLDGMETEIAELERRIKAEPKNEALPPALATLNEKYHKLLAERNEEAEKTTSTGSAISGILGILGVITGIGLLGGAGTAIGRALKRAPRSART